LNTDLAVFYDDYWKRQDLSRLLARSEVRATLALELLGANMPILPKKGFRPRLLEIGCGPGYSLARFDARGYEASGVDISPVAVEMARGQGLRAELRDITKTSLSGEYEVLVALEVLEHLADPLNILMKMKEVLSVGGCLVVSLPNEFHLVRRASMIFGKVTFGGYDDPHVRYFDDRLAKRLFHAAGLEIVDRRFDVLVPPRHRVARKLLQPLLHLAPGLFAISNVYLLVPSR
jgi:2-polyprenyl-3-methyl-5-hydroxy-6-metoxy-1,4-benzoquinol methylase